MAVEKIRILIAEDDELTCKAIMHRLEREGYKVDIAKNGKQALTKLDKSKFDILLVDIHMPHVTGLEIIKYVRKEKHSTIPIAVVSRIGSEKTVLEAFELGADDYITKPFNPEDLVHRVQKLISR